MSTRQDARQDTKQDTKQDNKAEAKETLEDAVRRTQREYSVAATVLLEAKDALASALSHVREAQDNTLRAQSAFSAAKEQHMMSIIQQQSEQLKSVQRQDNVGAESPAVVVDMKGQPFNVSSGSQVVV